MTPRTRKRVTKGWALFKGGRPWSDYIYASRKSAESTIALYAGYRLKLTLRRATRTTIYTLPAGRGRT